MTQSNILPNVLDGAKKLFIQELEGQILQVKSWFDQNEFTLEDAKKMKSLFHKIKGGASFFSMDELKSTSDLLQKHCELDPKTDNWCESFKQLAQQWLEIGNKVALTQIPT